MLREKRVNKVIVLLLCISSAVLNHSVLAAANPSTFVAIPEAFGNMSPGPDFLWGTADDVTDLATANPGVTEDLNDIGGAGITFTSDGLTIFSANGTAEDDGSTFMFGVPLPTSTITFTSEYLGNPFGVDCILTLGPSQSSSVTFFEDNTYAASGERTDNFGQESTFTTTGFWINNGDDPDTIFGSGTDLANHFNILIQAINDAGISFGALTYEFGTSEITSSPFPDNVGNTSNFSDVFINVFPIAEATTTPVNVPIPLWAMLMSLVAVIFVAWRKVR